MQTSAFSTKCFDFDNYIKVRLCFCYHFTIIIFLSPVLIIKTIKNYYYINSEMRYAQLVMGPAGSGKVFNCLHVFLMVNH